MKLFPITIPGGSDTHVQYNNGGIFGGDSTFTFNDTTKVLTTTGQIINGTIATGLDMSGGTFATAVQNWPADPVIQQAGAHLIKIDDTNFNTLIGTETGQGIPDEGQFNIMIGYQAGKYNDTTGGGTQGDQNVYIGYQAGMGAVAGNTGTQNIGIGYQSLKDLTSGQQNVALGRISGSNLTTGSFNFALGSSALVNCITGSRNVAVGRSAGSITTGSDSVFIGDQSGGSAASGASTVAIGAQAVYRLTGNSNTGIGKDALRGASGAGAADSNVGVGYQVGYLMDTGDDNCLYGYQSGYNLSSGGINIFLGYKSGINQTTISNTLIIDNQDRGAAATELTNALIYGTFHATVASQQLTVNAGTLNLNAGTDTDMVVNFTGTTNSGVLTWNEDLDYFNFADDIAFDDAEFIILDKASGNGIKVDTTTPTFGFADLLGDQFSKNTGATKPALATYNGAIDAWQFSDGDEAFMSFHIPHDYVAGTDIHLHIHWSQTSATATGGTIDFKYFAIYAKGHNQASGSTFTGTPITASFSSIDINDGGSGLNQYQHHLTEVTISAATATAALFDRDDFEPDGVIELTLEMDTNSLTDDVTVLDPFIHYVDIHYQTTGLIGTKSRTPDFYA